MSSLNDKSAALRLLSGLENGTLSAADAYNIAKDRDPILVYFVLRYIKEKCNSSDPQAQTLHKRLLELLSTYDDLASMLKQGEKDPMREWFDDGYSVRDFYNTPEAYIDLIIEKLEG